MTKSAPWICCKVAFEYKGSLCDEDNIFNYNDWPDGWEINAFDASGFRLIVVFQVTMPKIEDGKEIVEILNTIAKKKEEYGARH